MKTFEQFARLVEKMREAQDRYRRTHDWDAEHLAMELEKEVDHELVAIRKDIKKARAAEKQPGLF